MPNLSLSLLNMEDTEDHPKLLSQRSKKKQSLAQYVEYWEKANQKNIIIIPDTNNQKKILRASQSEKNPSKIIIKDNFLKPTMERQVFHVRQYPQQIPKQYLSLRFGKRPPLAVRIAKEFALTQKNLREVRKDLLTDPAFNHLMTMFRSFTRHIFASLLKKCCRLIYLTCSIELDYQQFKHWETNYYELFDLGQWMPEKDINTIKKVIRSQFDFSRQNIYIYQLIQLLITLKKYDANMVGFKYNCLDDLLKIQLDKNLLAVEEPTCRERKKMVNFKTTIAQLYLQYKDEKRVYDCIVREYSNYIFTFKQVSGTLHESMCTGLRKILMCKTKSQNPLGKANIYLRQVKVFIKKLIQSQEKDLKCLCLQSFLTPSKCFQKMEEYQDQLHRYCLKNFIKKN